MQRAGGGLGTALLAVVLARDLSRLGLVGQAFGHAFLWSLALVLLAGCAAWFLSGRADASELQPDATL